MTDSPLDVADARRKLGSLWGLDRALTRAELARALDLSPKYGGSHISKLEHADPDKRATLSGPIEVAIRMMLAGARPHTMDGVIKPGYPRGGVVE
jgi:hypothetical protein